MRPGDRVRTVCTLYDRAEQLIVPAGTLGAVDQISMFGRRLLVDYDTGHSLRHPTRHCLRA